MGLLSLKNYTHEEWLEWRRQGIGGSDAPSILEAPGAYRKPSDIWKEKVHGIMQADNPAMKRGRDRESIIREWFENFIGDLYRPMLAVHDQYDWIRASLDGINIACTEGLEIKNAGKKDHATAVSGEPPIKYWVQCQHQMMAVPTLEKVWYVSCPADGEITDSVVIEINRDDEYIQNILFPKEKKFWQTVITKECVDESIADDINMDNDPDFLMYVELDKQEKEITEKKKEYCAKVKEKSNYQNIIGNGYRFTKIINKGAIKYEEAIKDYLDNLKAHYPEIDLPRINFEPYRKEGFEKWKLSAMN